LRRYNFDLLTDVESHAVMANDKWTVIVGLSRSFDDDVVARVASQFVLNDMREGGCVFEIMAAACSGVSLFSTGLRTPAFVMASLKATSVCPSASGRVDNLTCGRQFGTTGSD